MTPERLKGVGLVLSASALWGASGPLTKILRDQGFEITDILAWRYLIGFLGLWLFSRVLLGRFPARIDGRRLRSAVLLAICIFAVNAAFTWSNFFTTVANAIALSFTAPLFAALLGWLFLHERVSPAHGVAIAGGIVGVGIFVVGSVAGGGPPATPRSPNIPLGNALALLSGLLFGGYFVVSRRFAQRDADVVGATIWQFGVLSLLLAPLGVLTLFKPVLAPGYLYLSLYSTLCTAAPILMLNLAGLYLKAHEASLLALSEVPFSIAIGMLLVREFPSLLTWVGVGCIVAAGVIGAVEQD